MALQKLALQAALKRRPKISISNHVTTVLLAGGVGLGIFFGIRAVAKNFKKGIRERQALIPNNPAAFASQLKLAFENDNAFGWGTDEAAVFSTLEEIPNKATFNSVQRAYRDLYGKNLSADLKSELTVAEYNQVLQIINAKF